VPLYLVRHAKAGSRHHWEGPDEQRPLTRAGRAQAEALATLLGGAPVERVLSSPYVRCVQTVEPLAAKVGTTVEATEALAEGGSFEPVLALLAALADHSVLCTHGDLVPATVDALVRRGMTVSGEPDWRKGATWMLERDGHGFTRGRAFAPPT
jgi:phosphohistidine phosphatase SixA